MKRQSQVALMRNLDCILKVMGQEHNGTSTRFQQDQGLSIAEGKRLQARWELFLCHMRILCHSSNYSFSCFFPFNLLLEPSCAIPFLSTREMKTIRPGLFSVG